MENNKPLTKETLNKILVKVFDGTPTNGKIKIHVYCRTYGLISMPEHGICSDPMCPPCRAFDDAMKLEVKKQLKQNN